MDNSKKLDSAVKAEMTAIIIFLGPGAAEIDAKSETVFQLKRKGSTPLDVSVKALSYLARKNWVKRDGKHIRITANAPRSKAVMPDSRETEELQLPEAGEARVVTRLKVESPIDYLALRKDKNGAPLLSKGEWSAGDRLRSDFTRANMLPGIGMRWGEPVRGSGGAGGGVNQTDAAMAARARVNKALEAVGPEFSGLLIDVCCFLKGLELVEAERKWPQRSAKLMLRAGLSILSRHYSLPARPATKIRTWASADYRPTL